MIWDKLILLGDIFSLNTTALGFLVNFIIALLILFGAIRIPLKRKAHHIFIIFVSDVVLWAGLSVFGQTAENPETYQARVRWVFFVDAAFTRALLCAFAFFFVGPGLGRRKYALAPVYAYAFSWMGILLVAPALSGSSSPPRITPLGWSPGPNPLSPYINPFGISLETVAVAALTGVVLIRHYRSQHSPIVRGQTRYLLAGSLLFYGAAQSFFLAIALGGPSPVPYLNSVALAVMLVGLRKHGFFSIAPVAESQSKLPLRYNLPQASAYLAFEPEPKQSFEIFSNLAQNGYYGLCITRFPPNNIRETYGLKSTSILWLTEEKGEYAVAPSDLHGLLVTIKAFLQKAERSVIMLHGLEYLVSVNGFKPVMRLIVRLNDFVLQKNGLLLLPLVPGTINEKQQTFLSAECPSLQRLEVSQDGEALTSPFQPRQELHPLLANAPLPAAVHVQEPLHFKLEDAQKVFRFLAKAFLQDYTVQKIFIDNAGWRSLSEIAVGATLPISKMYGRGGEPGSALAELMKRGLAETKWLSGQRGRGGETMKVRINYGNPYVKAEVDRFALQP